MQSYIYKAESQYLGNYTIAIFIQTGKEKTRNKLFMLFEHDFNL